MKLTYGQNNEDVVLWRAFKDQPKGFYIDVGAAYPSQDSVTKIFYEAGWNGVNIEPNKELFQLLEKERPQDWNLNVGIGNSFGKLPYYKALNGWGLSSFDKDIVIDHEKNGFVFEQEFIEVLPLEEIFLGLTERVDFLKIDVEGLEKMVIEGANLSHYIPKVIVIESVLPLSTQSCHDKWEYLLTNSGYKFALFDGLNRFYVHKDEPELLKKISAPANVFDNFIPYRFVEPLIVKDQQINSLIQSNQLLQQHLSLVTQKLNEATQEKNNKLSLNKVFLYRPLESELAWKQVLSSYLKSFRTKTEATLVVWIEPEEELDYWSNQIGQLVKNYPDSSDVLLVNYSDDYSNLYYMVQVCDFILKPLSKLKEVSTQNYKSILGIKEMEEVGKLISEQQDFFLSQLTS